MEDPIRRRVADLLSLRFLISVLVIVLVVFCLNANDEAKMGFISSIVGTFLAVHQASKPKDKKEGAIETVNNEPGG